MLRARGIGLHLRGHDLLSGVDCHIDRGEVLAILGPNGAGKSSLLRVLAREVTVTSGSIDFDGRPLRDWDAMSLARHRAVLPQAETLRFDFSAREVVRLGRYPWSNADDAIAVQSALHLTDTTALAERAYPSLSQGERARVQFARVLAQLTSPSPDTTRLLLLDEPTASLDPAHQHAVLGVTRRFARNGGAAIVVLHDLNLALHYADRVLLLSRGHVFAQGPAQTTLDAARLSKLFGIEVDRIAADPPHPGWIVSRAPVEHERENF